MTGPPALLNSDIFSSCGWSPSWPGWRLGSVPRKYERLRKLCQLDDGDHTLSSKDEFSWTASIAQHTKCGQPRQALRTYDEMLEGGVEPSSYTIVAALKACSSLQDLERAQQIHTQAISHGFESVVFVANMLVDAYAKCGNLVNARGVFEKMPYRTVVSWNAMIFGYVQMEDGEEALQLFARMQYEGVQPNERTFVGALKACTSLSELKERTGRDGPLKQECLDQVKAIHAQLLKNGPELAVFVGTMLVDVYAKCGSLEDARYVFERMPYRDVVAWTAMILAYAQMEEGEVALELYTHMQQEKVVPNYRTFVGALKACSSLATLAEENQADGKSLKRRCLQQVKAIHKDILKSGCELGVYVGTMLVDVYAKCGNLDDAMRVFQKMPQRDVVSWSAMIMGCAQMDKGEVALQLYTQMQQEAITPNVRTFVGVLKACSSLAILQEGNEGGKNMCLEQARGIHLDIVKSGCESALYVGTMLVDVYAKCGSLDDARRVFEDMPHRNVVSWNALIWGYTQMEQGEEALQLFARMQREGVESDDRTFVGALSACTSLAGLGRGKEIHAQISETALGTDPYVATCLINMYGKCGSMVDAQHVFDGLPTRDVVTCSALMSGYAQRGDSGVVFKCFQKMRQEGIQPDGITFLSVLTVCNNVGLLDDGRKYFEAMRKEYGITPTVEHYNCVVDLLGRAGQLDEAMVMAESLESSVGWTTLLGACQKWRNVELGRYAFERAVVLNTNDAAAYVLMSNIYAAANMWEQVKNIQAMRLKRQAWKQPGYSWWTDDRGIVHAFVVGDREHSESRYIHALLDNLFVEMKGEVTNPILPLSCGMELHAASSKVES